MILSSRRERHFLGYLRILLQRLRRLVSVPADEWSHRWGLPVLGAFFLISLTAGLAIDYCSALHQRHRWHSWLIVTPTPEGDKALRQLLPDTGPLASLLRDVDRRLDSKVAAELAAVSGHSRLADIVISRTRVDLRGLRALQQDAQFREAVADLGAFYGRGSDPARALYETQSVLAVAEAALVGAIGIALPLLISLWRANRDDGIDLLDKLVTHRERTAPSQIPAIDGEIEKARQTMRDFLDLQPRLRPLLKITLAAIVIQAFVLISIDLNFMAYDIPGQYVAAVVAKVMALCLAIWFVALIFVHTIVTRPMARRFDDYLRVVHVVPSASSGSSS